MAVSSSMDTDTMPPSQASTRRRSVAEIAQTLAGAGLMRYHSAPSSVLSSFIPNEDFFSEPIPHVGNSALTRFLSPVDELCTSISHPNALPAECFRADMRHATGVLLNTNPHLSADAGSLNRFHATTAALHQPPARCNKSQTTARHLLSSIHEHVRDCDCRISTSSIMQVDMEKHRNSESSLPEVSVPMSASSFCQSLLATTKSNLIRHSSFPANFVSGRAMEVFEEGPTSDLAGLRMQTMVESGPPEYIKAMHFQTVAKSMPQDNVRVLHGDLRETHISHDNIRGAHFSMPTTCSSFNGASNSFKVGDEGKVGDAWCLESPLSIARSPLFRQGSSPSGIVSQSSLDGTLSGCEKGLLSPSSGSSSDDDRRGKEAQYLSRMSGFWDEGGSSATTFGQRKREREIEDTIANGSHVVGTMQKGAVEEETLQWSFDGHMDMGSGGLLRMDDSVLCRARAKRGCATHPRSIAERVRRTKISEGMRKLQELVPNMEKQTNTATMLDEAVEYVKFLQQQVQKLSENQAKCNGMCNSMGNT